MNDHQEEQIISSASEPVVEIFEETQEDGTVIKKKRTTRKITKRVLTTTTSIKEDTDTQQHNHNHSHAIAASESGDSTLKDLSVGSAAESISTGSSTTTTTTTTTGTATTSSATATETTAASSSETTEAEEVSEKPSTAITDESKRTFKFGGIFGKGDVENHPFYRFLAKFPLKQSPAPHTRPRPVKPTIYAFAPGWKVGGQETEKQDNKDVEAEKRVNKETIIGSFDVDSLKWMVSCFQRLFYGHPSDLEKWQRTMTNDTCLLYFSSNPLLGVLEVQPD